MNIQNVHTFTKGVNKDISDEYLPNDTLRDANNVIIGSTSDKEQGILRNIRSNRKLAYQYTLPSGNNTAIGSTAYLKEQATIEFVMNSVGNHEIRLIKDEKVYLVTRGSFLNFSKRVKAKMYGDYVVFTDDVNDVRLLNVQWAKNYSDIMNEYDIGSSFSNETLTEFREGGLQVGSFFIWTNGTIYRTDAITIGTPMPKPPNASYYTAVGTFTTEMYREINSDMMTLIPKPPTSIIKATYSNDLDYNTNNLYGDLYSFAYRYIYKDYRRSVWSPLSEVPFPVGSDYNVGRSDEGINNVIDLKIYTGSRDVIGIEIGFKKSSSDLSFNIIKTLSKYKDDGYIKTEGTQFMYSEVFINWRGFYNNEQYIAVSIDELYKAFDYIPMLSNNIEILNDGKVILVDNEDGISDIIDDVDYSYQTVTEEFNSDNLSYTFLGNSAYSPDATLGYHQLTVGTNGYKGGYTFECVVVTKLTFEVDISQEISISLPYDELKTDAENIKDAVDVISFNIRKVLYDRFEELATVYDDTLWLSKSGYPDESQATNDIQLSLGALRTSKFIYSGLTYVGDDIFLTIYESPIEDNLALIMSVSITSVNISKSIENYESLKYNSKLNAGILYYDKALRHGNVQARGQIKTPVIPTITTTWGGSPTASGWDFPIIKPYIEINHQPPEEAYYYKFVVTDNNVSDYIEYCIASVTTASSGDLQIDVNTLITDNVALNNNLQYQTWVFEEGDRMRLLAVRDTADPLRVLDTYIYDVYWDTEILSQDSGTGHFVIRNQSPVPVAFDLVEIYRPKKGVDENYELYFDTGELYEIGDAGLSTRYHKGIALNSDVDQVVDTSPAQINLSYGNCYIRKSYIEASVGLLEMVTENNNYSDFYRSNFYDKGRPTNLAVDLGRKRRDTHICFGGSIDINAKNNKVGTFDFVNFEELNSSFGKVTGVGQIGYTLHVIQENKITSFYMDTSVLRLADGGEQTVISNEILNNKQVSDFDYGTRHSDSIIKRNTHILLFDATRGAFTRIAKNGSFEISDYGYNSLSKELAEISRTADSFNIMGTYDGGNDVYIWFWYYTIGVDSFSGSAMFRDGENTWRGGIDFTFNGTPIEWINSYQNRIVTFLNGDAWLHEEISADNKEYNNLYTEDKESSVTIVFNKEPFVNKVMRTLKEKSEYEWLPSTDGDILIDESLMTSMIKISKKVENSYLLTFKRNTSTKIAGTALEKLNKGEVLRGKTATIKLRSDSNERNRLSFITIDSTGSEPI